MTKTITVTCLCPKCGTSVPITKAQAAAVLRAGVAPLSREHYSKAGKAGAKKRWAKKRTA